MNKPVYDENNLFAKILRNELNSIKFYEDSHALGIMDIMPQSPGHCLILAKAKARNILDIDPIALQAITPLLPKVAKACLEAFKADGISIMQYNEVAGGQSVFHLHFHIIPRFNNKKLAPHQNAPEQLELLEQQAKLLRAIL